MKATLIVLLATVALAVALGPRTLDAIQGQSNVESRAAARDSGDSDAASADRTDRRRGTKRKNHDDDDD
ncbi:hypothetical protein [Ottowia sp.]|uniref:hypothetical protein n=1 Tax=Ottowia sp. TaxID=1898956 RepID=UPI002C2BEFED|nr:hypothetical protein [Ottowia sp.]HRN74389.1 hypothetical protein [Ottowia sp.]HRQ01251.1 hypothetical protein [Ottowia sp.]